MAQRLLEARYVYHWNPLAGSLVGQLRGLGVEAESSVIATVTGLGMQVPFSASRFEPGAGSGKGSSADWQSDPDPPLSLRDISPRDAGGEENLPAAFAPQAHAITIPPHLNGGLEALGLRVSIIHRRPDRHSLIGPIRWRLIRRRIRRELGAGRAVTAFRAGLDLAGPTWGLIIGFDDDRRSWYRDGPLTEQVGPWLAEADFASAPELCVIFARVGGAPDSDALLAAAARAQTETAPRVVEALEAWIAILESDVEIDPQGHAQAAQRLAAGWGEAAEFWRGDAQSGSAGTIAQAAALSLSRFATLFPYPMGGAPNNPGLRRAAAAILRETIGVLES